MKFATSPNMVRAPLGPVAAAVSGESLGIEADVGNSFFFPTRRGENGLALSGQICRSEKTSPLRWLWWGGESTWRYFWDPGLGNDKKQKYPRSELQISPHSGDVFMTVWLVPFLRTHLMHPWGKKQRSWARGKRKREGGEGLPLIFTNTFKDDIRYPLCISIYQVSWDMGQLMACCLPRLQPFCCHCARYGLRTLTHFSMSTCLVFVMFHFWVWDWFCENLFITD